MDIDFNHVFIQVFVLQQGCPNPVLGGVVVQPVFLSYQGDNTFTWDHTHAPWRKQFLSGRIENPAGLYFNIGDNLIERIDPN